MNDTNNLRIEAGYALERGLYVTYKAMTEAADTLDTLCSQLAEAQRDSERINDLDVYVRLHPSQSVTLVAGNTSIRDHIDEIVAHWRTAIDAAKGEKNGA